MAFERQIAASPRYSIPAGLPCTTQEPEPGRGGGRPLLVVGEHPAQERVVGERTGQEGTDPIQARNSGGHGRRR
jgi:hypothetical protein